MTSLALARRMARVLASVAGLMTVLVACGPPQPPTVPLYRALQVGDLDQIKRHAYHGSDIDSPDGAGDYPLHVAARNGQVAITRVLLEYGARLDVRDTKGRTPLHLALARGRTEVAEVLCDAGATDSPQALLFALVRDGSADRDALNLLRRRRADINALDETGRAPLHLAVGAGRIALAKRLILAGADANLADTDGQTPLTLALRAGDADLIRMLRQYGARRPEPEPEPAPSGKAPAAPAAGAGRP
jgi:ankyrin repeat protein